MRDTRGCGTEGKNVCRALRYLHEFLLSQYLSEAIFVSRFNTLDKANRNAAATCGSNIGVQTFPYLVFIAFTDVEQLTYATCMYFATSTPPDDSRSAKVPAISCSVAERRAGGLVTPGIPRATCPEAQLANSCPARRVLDPCRSSTSIEPLHWYQNSPKSPPCSLKSVRPVRARFKPYTRMAVPL